MTALLVTGCTCAMTFGGGLLALRLNAYRAFVLAFAAGALVASALVEVIPEALVLLANSGAHMHHHHLMFACSLGFLSFYLLEQVSHADADAHDHGDLHDCGDAHDHTGHDHSDGDPHDLDDLAPQRQGLAGLWGAAGISVHSVLDGVAIGEAFHAGAGVGWIVALAVIVHKFADGVSTVSILMTTGRSPRVVNNALVVTGLAPLVGLGIQALVPLPLSLLALVLGWFSGVFLYLGAAALIPAAHAASRSRWLPMATLSGVALVYFVYLAGE